MNGWEKRELKIHGHMREVCKLSAQSTRVEIDALRKKMKRLQYGA